MNRFDVLKDGPFRYIHSTETGQLLTTLVKERNGNLRETGKFVEEDGEGPPIGRTLREWKAILIRRGYQRAPTEAEVKRMFAAMDHAADMKTK